MLSPRSKGRNMSEKTEPRYALVIDDDPDLRELLGQILASAGFEVDVLSDGIDALALEKEYAVILLDLAMPVFDGERLTSYWAMTNPEVLQQVIVLTGHSRFARQALPATFGMILKPFHVRELIALAHQCASQFERESRSRNAESGGIPNA